MPVRMMKKTGGRKSCWTVPLNVQMFQMGFHEHHFFGFTKIKLTFKFFVKNCKATYSRTLERLTKHSLYLLNLGVVVHMFIYFL